jgi:hypothetical protein
VAVSGVALVIISDGRGYLAESIPSLIEHADPSWFFTCLVVNDSGSPECEHADEARRRLGEWHGDAYQLNHPRRYGGAASISTAWTFALHNRADYVFHLEEDFTFTARIPLPEMLSVLKGDPNLANVVLRRGPHGCEGPGGYVGDDPKAHVQHFRDGVPYLVHDKGFWLSPGVYSSSIAARGWPEHGHEHDFSEKLRADGYRFAVYGTHDDPPRVTHIGDRRAAAWTW